MSTQTTEAKPEMIQKIVKLTKRQVAMLKVASHLNFMNESELIRLLIEQAYEKTMERASKESVTNI